MKSCLLFFFLLLPAIGLSQQDGGIIKFPPTYSADVVTIIKLGPYTHIINTRLFVDHEKERSEINGKIYPQGTTDALIKITHHDLGTEYCISRETKTYWTQSPLKLPPTKPNLDNWIIKSDRMDGIDCLRYDTKALDKQHWPCISIWISKSDNLPLRLRSAGGTFEKKWFHFNLKKPDAKLFELPEGYKETAKPKT